MARVLLLTADLLFGSRVQGQLQAAGEQVELTGDPARVRALLAREQAAGGQQADAPAPEVLVVDLTDAALGGLELVASLQGRSHARTLGFYSHVEVQTRERAERAGFELIVPRSRMAREGAALVAGLAASGPR